MLSNEELRAKVVELRTRLGMAQTAFAAAIGKETITVRKYETLVPPRGDALAPLADLAIERGWTDLATAFRSQMIDDFAPAVLRVLEWSPMSAPSGGEWVQVPSSIPRELVEKFVAFMASRKGDTRDRTIRLWVPDLLNTFYEEYVRIPDKKKS